MQTLTAVPEDSTVTVDGVSRQVTMPETDPNIRAIRFHPNKDGVVATFEVKQGFKNALTGAAALAFVAPFVEAWEAAAPQPAPAGEGGEQGDGLGTDPV